MAEFVADRCELDPAETTAVKALWEAWKKWAEENGHQSGHTHLFGRNLKAATGFKVKTARPRGDGETRFREYKGIRLKLDTSPAF